MNTNSLSARLLAFGLCALSSVGLAGCENSDEVLVVDGGPPAIPSGVYTITGDEQVEVIWNPVRGDNVEGYGVYRSDALDGAYQRQATVYGEESNFYVDGNVVNGVTYFYAVDAFNFRGQESELSYEDAFDTPRPAGTDLVLWANDVVADSSGLDLSAWDTDRFVLRDDATNADFFVQPVGTGDERLLFAKGRFVQGAWNDLQDFGYTDSLDDISAAPGDGWSASPTGVELIEGHTYIVWTHNDHFAKFRVEAIEIDRDTELPLGIEIDWAYQIDPQNPELSPYFMARTGSHDPEARSSRPPG